MKIRSASRPRPARAALPLFKPAALAVALALAAPRLACAGPTGATVVGGQAAITQRDPQTTVIRQGSDKAIINWRSFSIGSGQSVQFQQPGSNSVALNRVTTATPSEIHGVLSANGKVFLVNPSGILFGAGASVDVGGLVASTLDIRDDDFLAGRYVFANGGNAGGVRNQGRLSAAERGTIALLGAQVSNEGVVSAQLGTVGLAAGGRVSLDFAGDGLTRIVVDAAHINALVENGGAVLSDGGQVVIAAHALGSLANTVVKNSGTVQARSLVERNGRIVLDGGAEGKVEVAGRLDASGLESGRRGGAVTVLGRDLGLAAGGQIDARGDAGGGTVLVGGDEHGANPALMHAASASMAAGAVIHADALGSGDGGTIVLWSDGPLAAQGALSARGGAQAGNGGLIETSGQTVNIAGLAANASAPHGKAGTWLLDPEDISIGPAEATAIGAVLTSGTNATTTSTGSITVRSSITKTAAAPTNGVPAPETDATLTLNAAEDIIMYGGPTISSDSGKLHVHFNANADGKVNPGANETRGFGAIGLSSGSVIATHGGDIRLYGQSDPDNGSAIGHGFSGGIALSSATLDTCAADCGNGDSGGRITMRAAGTDGTDFNFAVGRTGIELSGATLRSASGAITLDGTGGMGYIDTSEGTTRSRSGIGVDIDLSYGGAISTTSGAMTIRGSDGGGRASTATGSAGLRPAASTGLRIIVGRDGVISSQDGNIELRGNSDGMPQAGASSSGAVLDLSDGGIATIDGNITIVGEYGARRTSIDADLVEEHPDTTTGLALSLYSGATIATISGAIELRGNNHRTVGAEAAASIGADVYAEDGSIATTDGPVSIIGLNTVDVASAGRAPTEFQPDSTTGLALRLDAGTISTIDGAVTLRGDSLRTVGAEAGANTGAMLALNVESSIATIGGAIAITGIDGALAPAGAGASPAFGPALSTGLDLSLNDSALTSSSGDIALRGESHGTENGDANDGLGAALLFTYGGRIGSGGSVDIVGIAHGDATRGLHIASDALGEGVTLSAGAGGMLLAGRGTSETGLSLQGIRAVTTSAGRISVAGESATSSGIGISNVVLGSAEMTGDIVLRAASTDPLTSTLAYGEGNSLSSMRTAGTIVLFPGGVDASGAPVAHADVPIHVGSGDQAGFNIVLAELGIGLTGTSRVVIGNAQHKGAIRYSNPTAFAGDLGLQNGGAGSGGIEIGSDIAATGQLTLSSGGTVAPGSNYEDGGPVLTAPRLLLHGSTPQSNFQLASVRSRVNRFAARFDLQKSTVSPEHGDVNFRNTDALTIGSLNGVGYSAATNAVVAIDAPATTVAGDVLVDTSGNLTLEQNVATLGSDITLVGGGLFLNPANSQLLPGGGGNWRVFADTWVGEVRGSLTPSRPFPNYYGCSFGSDGCSVPTGGNHFFYRQRPTLTLSQDGATREYGDADPVFGYSGAGLVNGDTLADAALGGYTSSASAGASPGSYTTNGSFTSPVGYQIVALPGSLSVTPATILVSVDDKRKTYGGADPLPSATLTGFKLDDTAGVVGDLRLSTATGPAATAGTHAIVGADASAVNYRFVYEPGVLTVDPAALQVIVANASKTYGDPDPALGATFAGLQYDDTAAVVNGLALSSVTGAAAGAGTHPITGAGASAANYSIAYQPGTLTVAKAPLLVVADDKAKVYGDPEPLLTASFSGLKYADTAAAVGGLTLTAPGGAEATAGLHAITVGNGAADNYTLDYRAGSLAVAKAALTVAADNKIKVYGAPDPALTATMTGLRYGDTGSAVSGLTLQTASGPSAGVGSHAITASDAQSANYTLAFVPGVLEVEPAVLSYVATPVLQFQDVPLRPLGGTVTGFVYSDTAANATSGTLAFNADAVPQSLPGSYAIRGAGLSAANYRFVQAPSNDTALTLLPSPVLLRPTIVRDISFESSNVYEKNFGTPRLCVGTGPLGMGAGGGEANDTLALEWSRVRVSPNLSNCLGLGQRNSCSDF